MALFTVNMTDEQLEALYEAADKHADGNGSELIRTLLSERFPKFGLAVSPRPRRTRRSLRNDAIEASPALPPVLVQLVK